MVQIKKFTMLLEQKNKYHPIFQDIILEKDSNPLILSLKHKRVRKKKNSKLIRIHKDILSMEKVQEEQKFTMLMGLRLRQPLLSTHTVHMEHMETLEEQKFTTV